MGLRSALQDTASVDAVIAQRCRLRNDYAVAMRLDIIMKTWNRRKTEVSTAARGTWLLFGIAILAGCSSSSRDVVSCRIASLAFDVWPGAGSGVSYRPDLVVFGDRLYFTANDGVHGEELWMYVPDTGAELVVDIVPGSGGSAPSNLTIFNGSLYFSAQDIEAGKELWRYDPDDPAAGAERVADINPGSGSSAPNAELSSGIQSGLVVFNGNLYFEADDGLHGRELWMYDPAAGAMLVADLRPGDDSAGLEAFTLVNNTLYFTAYADGGRDLWFLDPMSAGVMRVDVGNHANAASYPHDLTVYDGRLFFSAKDDVQGRELWAHDPVTGTMLVADIAPGSDSSYPSGLTVMNDRLYMVADDGVSGGELWVYDPIGGMAQAADIAPGAGYAMRSDHLLELDNTLYFLAYNDIYGEEVWQYEPESGASLVADTVPGLGDTGDDDPEPPSRLRVFDGRLYFTAFDQISENRRATWVYDPVSGPQILTEVWPGSGIDNAPYWTIEFDGRLYFSIDDDVFGQELWVADPGCYG